MNLLFKEGQIVFRVTDTGMLENIFEWDKTGMHDMREVTAGSVTARACNGAVRSDSPTATKPTVRDRS
jgi:hypothetical protein